MSLSYPDAVQWYYSFARFDAKPPRSPDDWKLARMKQLLARLDQPHTTFPSILIAGTKGKGSTAALVESILRAAGYRTGLYTSPHLHSFRERVRVDGEMISQARVIQITEILQELAAHIPHSTFFEWVTALAFTQFAREQIEIAVVEVGLGGRLDCTNVLTPRVSVITSISYDHVEILGDTLAKIAYEKAGILKPHTPVVIAPQDPAAMEVIEKVAREKNAPVIDVARVWKWHVTRISPVAQTLMIGRVNDAHRHRYALKLLGPHQRVNLATALATIQVLRAQNWRISPTQIRQGIESVEWHARFEILRPNSPAPFPTREKGELISPRRSGAPAEIVIDGAHNRASAHELVRTLDEVFGSARVHFIFGASSDKDIQGMLQELLPRASTFILTQSRHARAAPPVALAELAAPYPLPTRSAPDVAAALALAQEIAAPNDVICVTGSLFIAAEARALMVQVTSDDS